MARRGNPQFKKVQGYIPRQLARRFKLHCFKQEIEQALALEKAINAWLDKEGAE